MVWIGIINGIDYDSNRGSTGLTDLSELAWNYTQSKILSVQIEVFRPSLNMISRAFLLPLVCSRHERGDVGKRGPPINTPPGRYTAWKYQKNLLWTNYHGLPVRRRQGRNSAVGAPSLRLACRMLTLSKATIPVCLFWKLCNLRVFRRDGLKRNCTRKGQGVQKSCCCKSIQSGDLLL